MTHRTELPWIHPEQPPGTVAKMQLGAAYANTLIDHMCQLNINSEASQERLTSIVCTIGPACKEVAILEQMMEAGMNVARLNFSHGTHEYHAGTIANLRTAAMNYSRKINRVYPLAIALDTKGPEIRTGLLAAGKLEVVMEVGQEVKLTTDKSFFNQGAKECLYVDYENIVKIVRPGDKIFVDDGLISLLAKEIGSNYIICTVENGGTIGSQKGINLPGLPVDLPALSDKDKEDILFGVENDVDMIFASFIRDAAGVAEIKELLGVKGRGILIIPKIENHQGVENIDEIIAVSDGIMVARGDLGIEIPSEKVFLAQKALIAKCNLAGKPVICATQMLESMVSKPRPTRAESTDVANAVLDGADCVMLSGESAKGSYPLVCVRTMGNICREAEMAVYQKQLSSELNIKTISPVTPTRAIAIAAVEVASKLGATAIIASTTSGMTGHMLSSYRPRCPVICVTRYPRVARQLQLYRNAVPLLYITPPEPDWLKDVDARMQFGITYGRTRGFINQGDALILVSGWRAGAGFTNTLRIVYASGEGLQVPPTLSRHGD